MEFRFKDFNFFVKVTPSSSCIANLVAQSSTQLDASNDANQQTSRKGSAPAFMPESLGNVFVVGNNELASPTTVKAVQFNVGVEEIEDRPNDNQGTILSDNENTITANLNLQSWRFLFHIQFCS